MAVKTPWARATSSVFKQAYSDEGIAYSPPGPGRPDWWTDFQHLPQLLHPTAAYLGQLLNEGLATTLDGGVLLPWLRIYPLLADPEHADSVGLLALPSTGGWAPCLESRGTPSDRDFRIAIVGWMSPQFGQRQMKRIGALLESGGSQWLMTEASWRTSELIRTFSTDAPGMSPEQRLRALGEIRTAAVAAGASLDDYLQRTSIVSPNKLEIELRRTEAMDVPVVEVRPHPVGAPPEFLGAFDRYSTVQSRYDISQPDGRMVHVAPSQAVIGALGAIKAIPGRRLASEQARLFARNPYAVLGDDAREALDEEALILERQEVGLLPYKLTFCHQGESEAPLIQLVPPLESATSSSLPLTPQIAKQLLAAAGGSRARGMPLFLWEGHEVELSPATEQSLTQLASWLAHASVASIGLTLAEVMDLEAYSDRVVGFDARLQTVPYVARRDSGSGWIPENVETGVAVVDRDTGDVQKIVMPAEAASEIQRRIDEALVGDRQDITLPNSETSIPIAQAQQLIALLQRADLSIGKQKPPVSGASDPKSDGKRAILQILHNIENLDYVTQATAGLEDSLDKDARLPNALRREVNLLPHQREGLAWLQRRYERWSDGLSGCSLTTWDWEKPCNH